MNIIHRMRDALKRRCDRIRKDRSATARSVSTLNEIADFYQTPVYSVSGKPRPFKDGEEAASDAATDITPRGE